MNTRHRKKKKKSLLPLLFLFFLLILGAYGFGVWHFSNHFLPKTEVNEVAIGNQTVGNANVRVQAADTKELFTFLKKGQAFKTVTLEDLGKSPDYTKDLNSLLKKQNPWSFPTAYFKKQTVSMGNLSLSDEEIAAYAEKIKPELTALNEGRTAAKNATLTFVDQAFKIEPEVAGNQLDIDKILTDFKDKLKKGTASLDVEDYVIAPSITKDDEKLKAQLASAKKISQVSGTYVINEATIDLPAEIIASWLTFTEGQVNLDQEKVKAYLSELASQYNTSSVPYSFNSTLRGKVSVPAGTYGWSIQVEGEAQALTETILKGENFSRTPLIKGVGSASGARIGKTYVEVDLQNQHMWYYKDGSLVLETAVVTGRPTTPTPAGVFYIWNKETPSVLRGSNEDGTKYETPVTYWMPVDWTGVGIHDANWQPTFGGDWWKEHGSHGCVNTPPGVMKELFEKVSEDTPVLIY